jgi:hypothetical protein
MEQVGIIFAVGKYARFLRALIEGDPTAWVLAAVILVCWLVYWIFKKDNEADESQSSPSTGGSFLGVVLIVGVTIGLMLLAEFWFGGNNSEQANQNERPDSNAGHQVGDRWVKEEKEARDKAVKEFLQEHDVEKTVKEILQEVDSQGPNRDGQPRTRRRRAVEED